MERLRFSFSKHCLQQFSVFDRFNVEARPKYIKTFAFSNKQSMRVRHRLTFNVSIKSLLVLRNCLVILFRERENC